MLNDRSAARVALVPLAALAATVLVVCTGGCGSCGRAKSDASARDAGSATSAPDALADSVKSGPFEGFVTTHVTNAPGRLDQDITYWVKGQKLRIDAGAPGRPKLWSTVDLKAHVMITVLDEMHAFRVLDLSVDAGRPEAWEHKKLGTVGRVADRDCVDWEARAPQNARIVVACMADERFFDRAGLGMAATVPEPWLVGMDGFPMRSVEKDESGREVTKTEVTRVFRQPVPDESLVVPKTYRSIDADTPNVTTGRMRK